MDADISIYLNIVTYYEIRVRLQTVEGIVCAQIQASVTVESLAMWGSSASLSTPSSSPSTFWDGFEPPDALLLSTALLCGFTFETLFERDKQPVLKRFPVNVRSSLNKLWHQLWRYIYFICPIPKLCRDARLHFVLWWDVKILQERPPKCSFKNRMLFWDLCPLNRHKSAVPLSSSLSLT